MIIKKLNETGFLLEDTVENINRYKSFLMAERPEARYTWQGQMGIDTNYYFYIQKSNTQLIIPNGFLSYFNYSEEPEFSESEINEFIDLNKPFEPYDYQRLAVIESILKYRNFVRSATGSGKSLIIGLIAKFLTSKNYKGLILVPNVSLVEQFKSDLESYNLDIKISQIGGSKTFKDFEKSNKDYELIISTYQSLRLHKDLLKSLDFILTDEAHQCKANEVFDINNKCENAKYKIGFSGTLPETKADRMRLISVFGKSKTYVNARGLIERGLATDCNIKVIKLDYDFKLQGEYAKQLKQLKEYKPRNNFIINLTSKLKGNTLVLFSHTAHGLELFYDFCKLKNTEPIEKAYKNIVFQKQNHIYFINGLIDGNQREIIRNILEKEDNAVLFANYATMSTGVNMKRLHNIVFASPLKSYVSITQSIGRGLRLHHSKDIFNLYDIWDNVGYFKSQFNHRLKKSYEPEGYNINYYNVKI